MRLTEEQKKFIYDHYPREGCAEPMRKIDIIRVIGCTDCAIEYQAAKMGIGRLSYDEILEKRRAYRDTNRVRLRKANNDKVKKRYREDWDYRLKRIKEANSYYHRVVKPKREGKS